MYQSDDYVIIIIIYKMTALMRLSVLKANCMNIIIYVHFHQLKIFVSVLCEPFVHCKSVKTQKFQFCIPQAETRLTLARLKLNEINFGNWMNVFFSCVPFILFVWPVRHARRPSHQPNHFKKCSILFFIMLITRKCNKVLLIWTQIKNKSIKKSKKFKFVG